MSGIAIQVLDAAEATARNRASIVILELLKDLTSKMEYMAQPVTMGDLLRVYTTLAHALDADITAQLEARKEPAGG